MTEVLGKLSASLADRYRIERELGAGGMATVYLAHDVRHNRKVALKVLRPELAAILGGERFLKEIQLTANLQHPHILPLHDSGEADGLVFYVMPFVEGESLRDRIVREKQLPVEDAVRLTKEVASALDYAHRHGVVHRDIKPENILLHDGSALVADFGIALAVSRTDSGTRMTETGMSLGTPFYMAPEQAMGEREITPRADVYALGCVLYEMLTGEPPFTGPTAQAIIARVMTEQPRSLTIQRHTVPVHVEAVVRKALEKLPADRFASAAEFAEAFDKPGSVMLPATAMTPVAAPRRWRSVAATAGTLIVVAALGAMGGRIWGPKAQVPLRHIVRFGIELPRDAQAVGATGSTIAVAPDGSRIVYVGRAPTGLRLYSRGLDQLDPVPIPGTDGGSLPFFSPDGQWLGFLQGRRLVKVSLAGGPVLPLCDVASAVYGATWTPGDTVIFATGGALMSVPAAGGAAATIAKADSAAGARYEWPDVLPDGRHVVLTYVKLPTLELAVLDRRTNAVRRLGQHGAYPRWVDAGYLVVSDPSGIESAVPFDPRRLAATGAPVPITDRLQVNSDGDQNFGVSRTGDLAYQNSVDAGSRIVLVDPNGGTREAGADTGDYFGPRFSPDGRRIAVSRWTSPAQTASDVWIIDPAAHSRSKLTFDSTAEFPIWSPDGRTIWYARLTAQGPVLAHVAADGSGSPTVTTERGLPVAITADGGTLVGHRQNAGGKGEIFTLRLGGADTTRSLVTSTEHHDYDPTLSPDGRWIAYMSDESGQLEIYVRPFPGLGGKWQVSLSGGSEPVWAGNDIVYRSGDQFLAATVRTQPSFEVTARRVMFDGFFGKYANNLPAYDRSRDGKMLLALQTVQSSQQSLYVVLNWFANQRTGSR